jgi:hypothetical protein
MPLNVGNKTCKIQTFDNDTNSIQIADKNIEEVKNDVFDMIVLPGGSGAVSYLQSNLYFLPKYSIYEIIL